MNPIKHLLFILRQRRAGNRVSFSAYLKGIDRIELGRGCKIHADASVDASRSSGVRFGDKVTLNRYAYVQGGEGGVRLGHRVEINNFSIVNGTGGVDIGDDTLVGPGVRIISYQHRHARETTIRTQAVDARPIRIGRDCWLGANSVILAGDDVVFEVGAGLGYLSAYCAQRVGSDRVFTYEANPELIPLIRATHARNSVAPTVTNALLAQGEGEREFRIEDDFWASSAHRDGGRAITVRQADLNAELTRIRPTFMIVDIEGGEAEFFAGADLPTVQKICVETHPDVLGDRVLSEMFAGLVAKGFALDFSLIRKNVFFFHRVR